jgi:hypothetical protein
MLMVDRGLEQPAAWPAPPPVWMPPLADEPLLLPLTPLLPPPLPLLPPVEPDAWPTELPPLAADVEPELPSVEPEANPLAEPWSEAPPAAAPACLGVPLREYANSLLRGTREPQPTTDRLTARAAPAATARRHCGPNRRMWSGNGDAIKLPQLDQRSILHAYYT